MRQAIVAECEPQADGPGGKTRAAPAAPRGRPPSLAACGAASMQAVRAIAAQAHGAPGKAAAAFDAQLEAAPAPSSSGTLVAKAKAASQSLFLSSGSLAEVVEARCGELAPPPLTARSLTQLSWFCSRRWWRVCCSGRSYGRSCRR